MEREEERKVKIEFKAPHDISANGYARGIYDGKSLRIEEIRKGFGNSFIK